MCCFFFFSIFHGVSFSSFGYFLGEVAGFYFFELCFDFWCVFCVNTFLFC